MQKMMMSIPVEDFLNMANNLNKLLTENNKLIEIIRELRDEAQQPDQEIPEEAGDSPGSVFQQIDS